MRSFSHKISPRNQMFLKLVGILHAFDAQEHQPQQYREEQEAYEPRALSNLRAVHRQRHGQTAADQHCRVDSPEQDIEMMAALSERRWIGGTVDRIAGEQTAEEHGLRH